MLKHFYIREDLIKLKEFKVENGNRPDLVILPIPTSTIYSKRLLLPFIVWQSYCLLNPPLIAAPYATPYTAIPFASQPLRLNPAAPNYTPYSSQPPSSTPFHPQSPQPPPATPATPSHPQPPPTGRPQPPWCPIRRVIMEGHRIARA